MEKEAFFKELERDGVAKVRANLATHVYPSNERPFVIEWLEHSSEAANAEQLALARRAALAAETANNKANTAIAIAVASIIITAVGIVVGVIVPHFWH
jgi:hypothetical protein